MRGDESRSANRVAPDPMNILFISSGRRDYLIEYFTDALRQHGSVHVANSDPLCSAFAVGDAQVVTPEIHSGDYISFLQDYCSRKKLKQSCRFLMLIYPS